MIPRHRGNRQVAHGALPKKSLGHNPRICRKLQNLSAYRCAMIRSLLRRSQLHDLAEVVDKDSDCVVAARRRQSKPRNTKESTRQEIQQTLEPKDNSNKQCRGHDTKTSFGTSFLHQTTLYLHLHLHLQRLHFTTIPEYTCMNFFTLQCCPLKVCCKMRELQWLLLLLLRVTRTGL